MILLSNKVHCVYPLFGNRLGVSKHMVRFSINQRFLKRYYDISLTQSKASFAQVVALGKESLQMCKYYIYVSFFLIRNDYKY